MKVRRIKSVLAVVLILLIIGIVGVACEAKRVEDKSEIITGVVTETRISAEAKGCKFFVRVDGVNVVFIARSNIMHYTDCATLKKDDKIKIIKYTYSHGRVEYRYKDETIAGEVLP